ncbi:tyrosine-type recombinase/integrase [uncultured Roseovarius sp.]|uniref:site-specific integrase n=1 Tax=uncultured Roseovarius sp. TaxID=293344 RepID=UPI002599A530|nr:tyrosine-type recombinase/integrase [uncultured Roseovarius sp.]
MKKQRKPYVTEKTGRLYYRMTWLDGNRRRERYIPLPNDEDSAEFDRAYWAIRSGTAEILQEAPRTSWEALIQSYRASRAYRSKKPGTRKKYDSVIEQLREKNGNKDVCKVTRAQIRAIHEKYADTPRKADHQLQVIRLLLNYAKNELDWIQTNPAEGIKLFGSQKEWQPWPDTLQNAFVKACQELGDDIALMAYHLGTGTGQRPGDLCGMKWEHYDGEYIAVLQDKTAERLWVYCPDRLRRFLDSQPKRGAYMIPKNLTQPLGYDALERRFRKVRTAIGKAADGHVMHGWRYTAAVALAEAGATDAEIQAVTGHKTATMAQKYRRQAAQRRLSRQAQMRRE